MKASPETRSQVARGTHPVTYPGYRTCVSTVTSHPRARHTADLPRLKLSSVTLGFFALFARGGSIFDNSSLGESSSKTGWKIVTFSSYNYLDISTLWYDRLTDLGYTGHVIAAMDQQLFDAFTAKGYRVEDHVVSTSEELEPGEPVPGWDQRLWKLWRYRMMYILRETRAGRNIFLVDVDTMWNRYVSLNALFNGSAMDGNTDVFLSQGTEYPPDVHGTCGFVGCMGTVAFRATKASQILLSEALGTCTEGCCDDQVAVNRALSEKFRVKWDRKTGVGVGVLRGASLTVCMWLKPFAFRSLMKDVRKVTVDEAARRARSPGSPSGAGTCLGQVSERKGHDDSSSSSIDFSNPFIVSPVVHKVGELKLEAWDKFQQSCFVIETKQYLQQTLPSPK